MKLSRIVILVIYFLVNALCASAQFEGIISFSWDSVFQAQLKNQQVRSVTETISEGGKTYVNGRCSFNKQGRIIESCRIFGNGLSLTRTEYTEKGLFSKQTTYEQKDTSKIKHWVKYTYDDKGRQIKEVGGYIKDGQPTESTNSESKITELKGVTCTEKQIYSGGNVMHTKYIRDSVSGIYTFNSTIEYHDRDTDKKGRKRGDKKLERRYTLDHCEYEDLIDYTVYGRLETAEKIKSYYHLFDAAGREIERGKIEYNDAFMAFTQTHPAESNYMVISPLFLKEFFAGKIKGEKEVNGRCIYNAEGQLIEKEHYRDRYSFKYNTKGQVIEQVNHKGVQETTTYEYNKKGLIIKTESKRIVQRHDGPQEELTEGTYSYTYY